MRIVTVALSAGILAAQPSVVTYHNDNSRTGLNSNETLLTPANVKAGLFGKRYYLPVDGGVYAQPLYLPRVKIPGKGFRNLLFVATAHDTLYAFDADDESSAGATPIWKTSFLNEAAGVTTVSASDVGCTVIPELGIVGTPVIDPVAGTIYLIAHTKENGNQFVYRMHSLDVTTGAERTGSPVEIQAAGFVPLLQKQRAALLLSNGVVYSPWTGHCDSGTYHGYIMANDSKSLKQIGVFNATPVDSGASFWNGGAGPSADSQGNIFAVSANGDPDGDIAAAVYDESVLRLAPAPKLAVTDLFTPFNRLSMDEADQDLGSSGALLLPDDAGTAAHPHLLFVSGKEGRMYLLDRDALGGAQVNTDSAALASLPVLGSQTFGMAAYFNGSIYVSPKQSPMLAFKVGGAALAASPWAQTSDTHAYPGATPSITSNGTRNGIVWIATSDNDGKLLAYDASNLNKLYDSDNQNADQLPSNTEFSVPTIADGKVFAGGVTGVALYGELAQATPVIAAVTNAASFAPDAISTGALVSLFGSNLAPVTESAGSVPLPISLVDTSVTINGVVAPLLYVSATQINMQVPFEVAAGNATVVVRSGGRSSAPFPISVLHAAPGLFFNGEGQAAVINDGGAANSAQAPASAGTVISVYLTGIGPVSTSIDDGTAPAAGQTIAATSDVTATIGGFPAEVQFAGLAPLYPGTAQVNLKVPAGASGSSTLVISIGGVTSNTVQLVISAN